MSDEYYDKIPCVFRRMEQPPHRLIDGAWITPEVELLRGVEWSFTEKVNGTNVRVSWNGHRVEFGGRTDSAQLAAKLVSRLRELFDGPVREQVWEQVFGEDPVILYGEGHGLGAAGRDAGRYAEGPELVLFDARVGDWWLRRADLEDVAGKFGLGVVPEVLTGTLDEGVEYVRENPTSEWGEFPAEGVVGRPGAELRDRAGKRILVKIKVRDLAC